MSRLSTSLVRAVVIVAVAVLSCTLAGAADQSSDIQIVETTVDSATLSWQPAISYKAAVLTVAGPGKVNLRREFGPGELLAFRINDSGQPELSDGQYAWELRFSPAIDADTTEALLKARETGETSEIDALEKQGKLLGVPQVVSGYFRIVSGSIVVAQEEAPFRRSGERVEASSSAGTVDSDSPSSLKDQQILDDLIVDGSICVGQDCVNGESFGFDTLRLKENNLRIRAYDTSSSASFPTRDWQITFNDSSNGGANKFSIDDIDGGRTPFTIEASAPSHSLYVEDGGQIGFGTSTPVVQLHLKDGNTPTLRLEQDGSSGFTPQTWDVAGNEANFFIRDASNGSTLPLRIFPAAPSNAITIEATTGDVGFGTTSPDANLDIEASGPVIRYTNTGAAGNGWEVYINGNTGRFNIRDIGTTNIPFKVEPGSNSNLLQLGVQGADRVDINGNLYINGIDNSSPDYVFEADFKLESIEEHATFMWENKHLPAVGPAAVDQDGLAVINVANRSQGVLEELEKAHIYIEQLNATITELQNRLEKLENGSKE